jgi:beta-fructofuranosidase
VPFDPVTGVRMAGVHQRGVRGNGVEDRLTPGVHVRPVAGWLNDPNGPVRWNGRYHLFFQHHPEAPVQGPIHWGHMSSADLTSWVSEPIALSPSPDGPDAAGCWSGCVVDDGGVPTAVYTGVRAERLAYGSICLARSDDALRTWVTEPDPVADGPPPGLAAVGFRDPYVFSFAGHRWAVVGAGLPDGPAALVYRCDDLRRWTYVGSLVDPADPVARAYAPATIWECPQLFRAGRRWVLMVSLWTDGRLGPVAYLTGDLVRAQARDGGIAPRLMPTTAGRVDRGGDFYAPAVLVEPERTLLWGWSWESCPEEDTLARGWAGVLTLPREVGTRPDGRLTVAPAGELTALRSGAPVVDERLALHAGGSVDVAALPAQADLTVDITAPAGGRVDLGLLDAADGRRLLIGVTPTTGEVVLDRAGWPAVPPRDDHVAGRFTPTGGDVRVRIIVDGPVLEIFAADEVAITERIYARPDDRPALTVASGTGEATVAVTCWEMAVPTTE